MFRLNKFTAVLKSEKFIKDMKEYRVLTRDLHTFNELREDFVWFLCAYPLSEGKKKVMSKLDGKKKFGLLSRHVMGVSRKLGMDNLVLSNYQELKDDEKYAMERVKEKSWYFNWDDTRKMTDTEVRRIDIAESKGRIEEHRRVLSQQLLSQTMYLMEFCFSKYDAREYKINQILEDE